MKYTTMAIIFLCVLGFSIGLFLYQSKRKESFVTGIDAREYEFDVIPDQEPTPGLLSTIGKVTENDLNEIKTTIEKITKLKVIELSEPTMLDGVISTEAVLDISDDTYYLSYHVRINVKERKIYTFENLGKKLIGTTHFADEYVPKMYANKSF